MKKFIKTLFFLFVTLFSITAQTTIVAFDFSGATGGETTINATTTNSSITSPVAISRGSGVNAANNADRYNSSNWSANRTADEYVEFTITPQSGYTINLEELVVKHQRSATGPKTFELRSSIDSYGAIIGSAVTVADGNNDATNTNTTTFPTLLSNITTAITFRIYAYGAENNGGSWGPGDNTGDDIILTAQSVLDVTYNYFQAKRENNKPVLSWQTATEKNTSYFDIQRTNNPSGEWQTIGSEKAAGNSQTEQTYEFVDETPLSINYYRLRIVDYDGEETYSKVVSVLSDNKGKLTVFPTIAIDKLTVNDNDLEINDFQIFDIMGRNHLQGRLNDQKELNVSDLPKGTYILKVGNGIAKFMKN